MTVIEHATGHRRSSSRTYGHWHPRAIRSRLPRISGLDADAFRRADRLNATVLFASVPTLAIVAIGQGEEVGHSLVEIGGIVLLVAVLSRLVTAPRWRASVTSFALMSACALLVHITGGLTESHFAFFVALPLVALYRDWVGFLIAFGTVVVHHALLGSLSPHDVYGTAAAQARPIVWTAVHAAFVIALTGVLIVYWYAAEQDHREIRRALDELRHREDELARARKLESIGQLAAGVAHEINTPIQFVGDNIGFLTSAFEDLVGWLDRHRLQPVIPSDAGGGAEHDDGWHLTADDLDFLREEVPLALEQSAAGVSRVAEIVRALKGVAHPNRESIASIDVNRLVSDTTVVARSEWKSVATLELDLDPQLPHVEGISGELAQAVLNLIVNSAHAVAEVHPNGPDTGLIRVATRAFGDSVTIDVEDNGPGIPSSIAERVFDPFFTTKEVGKGSGQGLAICHAVVCEVHGGQLRMSDRPGGGTCFTITLPIHRDALEVGRT